MAATIGAKQDTVVAAFFVLGEKCSLFREF